jgi:glyoxylase-like metal-dependent hydrolase (beta-lactamase superfamily II)
MKKIGIGAFRIAVINLGDLKFALKDVIAVPEEKWRHRYGDLFERKQPFPTQSVLVDTGTARIVVDAGEFSKFAAEGAEYVDKNYQPPPGLVEQLETLGVKADQVSHVVITHAHYDHFAGVTVTRGEEMVPAFPKARHYLGRGDWEWSEVQKAVADGISNEAKTLGRLRQLGVLELVSRELELVPGVSILPAPGESPGHQVLKVQSEGHTAYCVGDLFHDSVEVENPDWMATWCDPMLNTKSRKALLESALRERAVIIPSHMSPGVIKQSPSGARYEGILPD